MNEEKGIIELNKFINAVSSNNTYLNLHIDEIKTADLIEPLFQVVWIKDSQNNELNIFSEKEAVSFNNIVEFIGEIQLANKNLIINSRIKPLMSQYTKILENKLTEDVLNYAEKISINTLIKDIKESKLEDLTKNQQQKLFNDLCICGNESPMRKMIDFALSGKDKKDNLNENDIYVGLANAIENGHLNIVKAILDHEKINNVIDFSNRSSDLKNILPYAFEKDKKEILSYIMNDKQYKVSESEMKYYNHDSVNVKRFLREYKNSLPKVNKNYKKMI